MHFILLCLGYGRSKLFAKFCKISRFISALELDGRSRREFVTSSKKGSYYNRPSSELTKILVGKFIGPQIGRQIWPLGFSPALVRHCF